jgi:hypothetical protein
MAFTRKILVDDFDEILVVVECLGQNLVIKQRAIWAFEIVEVDDLYLSVRVSSNWPITHIDRERRVLLYIESFQACNRSAVLRNQEIDGVLLTLMNKCDRQCVEAGDGAPRPGPENYVVIGWHGKLSAKQDFNLPGTW